MRLTTWTNWLQSLMRSSSRLCARKRRTAPVLPSRVTGSVSVESLEDRVLLTVEPVTFADPAFWGETGYFGNGLNSASTRPSISADGQLVVFQSEANNLVPNDFNNTSDVFLYNRGTGEVTLLSVTRDDVSSGNRESIEPIITPDGRYVVFRSAALQLDEDIDTPIGGGSYNLFYRDLQTSATHLITTNSTNTGSANSNSLDAAITPDGRYVTFASFASNLVANDTNDRVDIFMRDLQTGTTELISVTTDEAASNGNSSNPSITPDGRFVVFASDGQLASIDNNGIDDVYIRDRVAGTTELVSADSTNSFSANAHAGNLTRQPISDDGRYVVFWTGASNIVPGVSGTNAYIRDVVNNQTFLISRSSNTNLANGHSVVITPDGQYAAWLGNANNTASDIIDTAGRQDVYRSNLTNLNAITTQLVSVNAAGTNAGNGHSGLGMYPFDFSPAAPEITPDGRYVAFSSIATDLVAGVIDANNSQGNEILRRDVFLRDMQTGQTSLVSQSAAGTVTGKSGSFTPSMNDPAQSNGRLVVAFESAATEMTSKLDGNGRQDLFVRDLTVGSIDLISHRSPHFPIQNLSSTSIQSLEDITPDGRFVLFTSSAVDLTTEVQTPTFNTYVYLTDRQTGVTEVVSVLPGGTTAGVSVAPARISNDGRYVYFNSHFQYVPGIETINRTQIYRLDRITQTYEMVTVSTDPTAGQHGDAPAGLTISGDGRYAAWVNNSLDLVPGFTDNNGQNADVYVRDMVAGVTRVVSHLPGDVTAGGNGRSYRPVFSADGSTLIFNSSATNLVSGIADTNGQADLFAYGLATQAVQLVSVTPDGTSTGNSFAGDRDASPPVVSADGRYVAFVSSATNLVAGIVTNAEQIFRRDLLTGVTELVSINSAGTTAANNASSGIFMTPDGQKILFESRAINLTNLATNNKYQVYLRDYSEAAPTTTLVSLNSAGTAGGNSDSSVSIAFGPGARITDDGRYFAFQSFASDLVPGFVDGNGNAFGDNNGADLYIRDLQTGVTALVSYNNSGTASAAKGPASGQFGHAGTFLMASTQPTVIFDGSAYNFVNGDRNGVSDLFAYSFQGTASIAGRVFEDADSDGVVDAGEIGIPYWTVYLDANNNGQFDFGEVNVQADADGNYRINGLAEGSHTVAAVYLDGFSPTVPTSPATYEVNLSDNTAVLDKNFGAHRAETDLLVTAVNVTSSAAVGDDVTVTWTVRNAGTGDAAGPWQDGIYLSTDDVLDPSDILLETETSGSGLEAGTAYTHSRAVRLPAVPPGPYRILVHTNRRNDVPNEANKANNVLASAVTDLNLATLTVGTPATGSFSEANQDRYYQITVPVGQTLNINLDIAATTGRTELYVSRFELPTLYRYDFASKTASPDQQVSVPLTQPGTYYILVHSTSGAAATANFTLTANTVGFGLTSVSPVIGGNTGQVTLELTGARFTPETTFQLTGNGGPINTVAVDFIDETRVFATFDLTGVAAATYTVTANNGVQTVTLPGAFNVEAGVATVVQLGLSLPGSVRLGRAGTAIVEYTNPGNVDMVAPLLSITATNALVKLEEQADYAGSSVQFLGISRTGPAGILRPGESVTIRIDFLSNGPADELIDFQVNYVDDPSTGIDWNALKDVIRPGAIPLDAWDAIYANLLAELGTTYGDYQALLARDASYLSDLGIYTPDVSRLLGYEIAKAEGVFVSQNLVTVEDASFPTPGTDLTFVRSQQQSIAGRYTIGAFGRGWTTNWDFQAQTLGSGDVIIVGDGIRHFYSMQSDGTYRASAGDFSTLSLVNGKYVVTEADSTVLSFLGDGRFDFVEYDNGNRVTAGYNGANQLTTLTHSAGQTITLHYNAQGRIDLLTDPAGRTVSYSYDASGEHLTSYNDKYGTHTYTYITGQGAQREHALASINFSDDTHREFTYDVRGRLIKENRDNGAEPLVYGYLPGGGYTITDAAGGTVTILHNDLGGLERVIDPLGSVVEYDYDENQLMTEVRLPDGLGSSYQYDVQGNLSLITNALGQQSSYVYDSHNNLLSFTDARHNTTSYVYDGEDNLVSATDPANHSELFTYDSHGNVSTSTNKRGHVLEYQYDNNGQITLKKYTDGSISAYTYDARGRLATATDSTGTVTLDYFTDDSLQKVTYADGKSLTFEYNIVGQRTKSVDQDGFTTNYTYDDLGRPDEITDGGGQRVVKYSYDAAGRLVREDKGNGTATTYEYNLAGGVLQVRNLAANGTTVQSFVDYTYDAAGRRTSEQTADGLTTYEYDPLSQLTKVTLPGGRTIQYAYDAGGNRTQVVDSLLGTTNYVVNNLNQYLSIGTISYVYDADGNLVSQTDDTGTTTYTFDDENQLTAIVGPGVTATYTYDVFGHRNSTTTNGQTVRYLIDPTESGTLAAEYTGAGALIAHYVNAQTLGIVSRVSNAGVSAYYDFDAQGNTIGLTDASGNYVNRYAYLPFGETTTLSSGLENPFTFVGRFGVIADAAEGLFYMRAREYDPRSGQFLSDDPTRLRGGGDNFRTYVLNSPTNSVDPTGLAASTWDKWMSRELPCNTLTKDQKEKAKTAKDGDSFSIKHPDDPKRDLDINYNGKDEKYYYFKDGSGQNFKIPKGDAGNSSGGGGGGGGGGGCPCGCPPGGGPANPPGSGPRGSRAPENSFDPNDIIGPAGVDEERYITVDSILPYTIHFENVSSAGAAAQEVFVTHQLDSDLDWSTFQLGNFGFGAIIVQVPAGLTSYVTQVLYHNLDGSPLVINVNAELNQQTGIARWVFRSEDPETGELPDGVLEGLLPPNDVNHNGEGFVTYTVRAKSDSASGTTIDQAASIVFDTNAPIQTNVYTNTIDAEAPSSQVSALPSVSPLTIQVAWSGTDGNGGSGLAFYDIYVSDNGGPFTLWQAQTTATAADFPGVNGHTYAFYSVATDDVGHREDEPATADATTTANFNTAPSITSSQDATFAKKDPPVAILPDAVVADSDENLGGGMLVLSITDVAVGKKQKRFDRIDVTSLNAIGSTSGPQFVNGEVKIVVQLAAGVTSQQVTNALRGLKFSTVGKGLKVESRTVKAQVTDVAGVASNQLTRTIHVLKKHPRSRENR